MVCKAAVKRYDRGRSCWLNRSGCTWLAGTKAGASTPLSYVDYIVIEKPLGHRLPGTGDLCIHDWDSRLRDPVTRLAVLTEQKLREEIGAKRMKKPSSPHYS